MLAAPVPGNSDVMLEVSLCRSSCCCLHTWTSMSLACSCPWTHRLAQRFCWTHRLAQRQYVGPVLTAQPDSYLWYLQEAVKAAASKGFCKASAHIV